MMMWSTHILLQSAKAQHKINIEQIKAAQNKKYICLTKMSQLLLLYD